MPIVCDSKSAQFSQLRVALASEALDVETKAVGCTSCESDFVAFRIPDGQRSYAVGPDVNLSSAPSSEVKEPDVVAPIVCNLSEGEGLPIRRQRPHGPPVHSSV